MSLDRFKKYFFIVSLMFLSMASFINFVSADSYGLDETRTVSNLPSYSYANDNPSVVIGKFVGAVLAFTGTIFFVLMIYGGITWMTSAGDSKKVDKAKDLITAAIIGVVIILSAYAIVSYIGTNLTTTS